MHEQIQNGINIDQRAAKSDPNSKFQHEVKLSRQHQIMDAPKFRRSQKAKHKAYKGHGTEDPITQNAEMSSQTQGVGVSFVRVCRFRFRLHILLKNIHRSEAVLVPHTETHGLNKLQHIISDKWT